MLYVRIDDESLHQSQVREKRILLKSSTTTLCLCGLPIHTKRFWILSLLVVSLFLLTYICVDACTTKKYVGTNVEIELNEILCHTSDRFVSVALDSSLIQERWHHLNISSQKFLLMAKFLSPGYLRIGGTMADRLIFSVNATDQPASTNFVDHQLKQYNQIPTDAQLNSTINVVMDGDVWSHSSDKHSDHITNFTMSGADWILINNFATSAGLKLLFDLNVLLRDGDNWDGSNALELIKFSDEQGFDVDWQLGNEPNSFRHVFNVSVNATQLGKDFSALKSILNTFPRYNSSLLVGPDVTRPKSLEDPALGYLEDFLESANGSIDAISWHQYYLNGHTAQLSDITPEKLNVLYDQIARVKTVVQDVYNDTISPPIWLSETGSAYGGGAMGLSDTFAAGFLWLDKLGVAAREGIDVVVRQSLYHGYYSMLDEKTLNPLPDWWLTVLYKMFVGPKVLQATTLLGTFRLYCHCTPAKAAMSSNGSITVFGMNMDQSIHWTLTFTNMPLKEGILHQYILTGENGLSSKSVLLNGVRLELGPDGSLPPIAPIVVSGPRAIFPPLSLGFIVVHNVDIPVCSEII